MLILRFKSLREIYAEEGTVKLVDGIVTDSDKENSDIVLVPQPSDDVNDPLNWPKWKKAFAFLSAVYFAFLASWLLAGISLGIPGIIKEFGTDLNRTVTGLVSWVVLTLGIANFLWPPTALYIGKRPVMLFVSFLFFATSIWAAEAKTFKSLVGARIVSALACAASEGLVAAINADLFFLHERGWWMGVYLIFLCGGVSLGGLVSGFVINAMGWRWHFWIGAIFTGVDVVAISFFFPETQYSRGTDTIITPVGANQDNKTDSPSMEVGEYPESRKKTFLQQLNPWSGINPEESYIQLFLRPFPMVIYPAIIFSALTFATTLGFYLAASTISAPVFQSPPYNFSPSINGLINIPSLIGNFFGAYCGGGLTDKIAEWHARRNNGIFEPESRLIALIIPFFTVPAGLLMYGFGVEHKTSWALPYVGFGLISLGITSIPSITMTYVVDAYLPVAFEALLLINAFKQIFAFGFAYGIVPWITLDGYQGAFGAMAGIQFALMLFGLPLYYYGKEIRHQSAGWKIISY